MLQVEILRSPNSDYEARCGSIISKWIQLEADLTEEETHPYKLFQKITGLCNHAENPEPFLADWNDQFLNVYLKGDNTPFILIKLSNEKNPQAGS